MYLIRQSKSYKRSLKKIKASGNKKILEETEEVIKQLSEGIKLSEKYKERYIVIDASKSIDVIAEEVLDKILQKLQ